MDLIHNFECFDHVGAGNYGYVLTGLALSQTDTDIGRFLFDMARADTEHELCSNLIDSDAVIFHNEILECAA